MHIRQKMISQRKINRILLLRPVSETVFATGHPRDIRVPFSLKYIESLLEKEGIRQVRLIDCMADHLDPERILSLASDFFPDAAVISPTTLEYELTLKISAALKEKNGCLNIVIGQDATASPERYIFDGSRVDAVLRGECELPFMDLLKAIEEGGPLGAIEGIFAPGHISPEIAIVKDPDALPFPAYSRKEIDKYKYYYPLPLNKRVVWGHVLSSRGCPYDCIFCSQTIRESYGKQIRLRDPLKVAEEISGLMAKGVNTIAFADDNFTTSRQHVLGICHEIKRRGLQIHWTAHARVDNCDSELLHAMKDAGCLLLRFGIESGSERIIRVLKKTQVSDWPEQAKEVFALARKLGISTAALFLIGNPTERVAEIRQSMSLARQLEPDLLQICNFTPYPGSAAYEELKEKIGDAEVLRMYHYRKPILNFSAVSDKELEALYKDFYRGFLFRPAYIRRHLNSYCGFYLRNTEVLRTLFNMRKFILG